VHWSGWIVVALGVILGGWLAFDGSRALIVGDYVTPSAGPHAGQLGPWSRLISAVGLDPRSTTVKVAHVALGLAWLTAAGGLAFGRPWAWGAAVGCSVASLWYAPMGTAISIAQLAVLFLSPLREGLRL
jgi:hypothetical protein